MNVFQGKFPLVPVVEDGYEFMNPVDAYEPQNEYGLHNMLGNVWEWVEDWFTTRHEEYLDPRELVVNPTGPATGTDKVKKGGSFLCHQSYCYRYRVAARYYSTPDSATLNTGFRCARNDITSTDKR